MGGRIERNMWYVLAVTSLVTRRLSSLLARHVYDQWMVKLQIVDFKRNI